MIGPVSSVKGVLQYVGENQNGNQANLEVAAATTTSYLWHKKWQYHIFIYDSIKESVNI